MGNASAGGLAYVTQGGGAGGGIGLSLSGNTSGVLGNVTSGTLFLAGGNNVTLSQNGQSVTISAGGAGAGGVNIAASNSTFTSGTVVLSAAGGALTISNGAQSALFSVPATSSLVASGNGSLSTNGSTISFGANAAALSIGGNSTSGAGGYSNISTGTGVLLGGNNITLSQNGASITISAASQTVQTQASGGIAGTNTAKTGNIAFTVNTSGVSINASSLMGTGYTTGSTTGAWTATGNSNGLSEVTPYLTRYVVNPDQIQPISAPGNASATFQYVPVYVPVTGTRIDALVSMSAGSAATTATGAIVFSAYAAIYTRNGSTLSSLSSGSTQTTYTYASNTGGATGLIGGAMRPISVPVNFNMPPGEYFVGFNMLTNTSSIGLSTTNYGLTLSMMGATAIQTAQVYAEITAATANSSGLYYGQGVYSAATTGLPAAVSISGINQTGAALAQANIALVFRNA